MNVNPVVGISSPVMCIHTLVTLPADKLYTQVCRAAVVHRTIADTRNSQEPGRSSGMLSWCPCTNALVKSLSRAAAGL